MDYLANLEHPVYPGQKDQRDHPEAQAIPDLLVKLGEQEFPVIPENVERKENKENRSGLKTVQKVTAFLAMV